MTSKTALEKAFGILGNPAQLAYALNITPWAVYKWNVNRPPKERCLDIQDLTNNQVTAEQLRPDINWEYEREQRKLAQLTEEA
ncbi:MULTISPECIES: YdaS family helix-turn-helix protein [unclassified Psychrobacter]|uniref:transcriptional regulator n=1 Tax=unclassified Psychrobacter TaxID=196806 RepID=UPI0025FBFA65|nr:MULTISPECIES: YdaS family helix-turn-helix protein [unclassified Psychrobacter]